MMSFGFKRKSFNQTIFKLSKLVKINFRIYGELKEVEECQFRPYSKLLFNVLKNSNSISKEVDIKFKRRMNNIECEINFLGSNSLSSTIDDSHLKYFKNAFVSFQKLVEDSGSDMSLINQYNSDGKIVSSGISFSFPI